jgi:hypothetical protein
LLDSELQCAQASALDRLVWPRSAAIKRAAQSRFRIPLGGGNCGTFGQQIGSRQVVVLNLIDRSHVLPRVVRWSALNSMFRRVSTVCLLNAVLTDGINVVFNQACSSAHWQP